MTCFSRQKGVSEPNAVRGTIVTDIANNILMLLGKQDDVGEKKYVFLNIWKT
jgi:hypothetical protein